jgi:hypothetical protein
VTEEQEALKLALEALEAIHTHADVACVVTPDGAVYLQPAITAIKEALAQPEQEPFGYFKVEPFGWTDCAETDEGARALYEAPPLPVQRQPLTDELYKELLFAVGNKYPNETRHQTALRYIKDAETCHTQLAKAIIGAKP